jgi:phosphate starvation-inducible protein PhoH
MTDEQIEKLKSLASQLWGNPANAVKTLRQILKPQQVERLKQIKLQAAGAAALSIPEVANALALTKEQRENFKALQEQFRDKTHGAIQGAKNIKQVRAILVEMREKNLESAVQALTPQQRKKFEKMKGPKINMDLSKV